MSKHRLLVELGERSYPILIGQQLLADLPVHLPAWRGRSLLLTDTHVAAHYLQAVRDALQISADDVMVVTPGESSKSMPSLSAVMDWMLERRLPRDGRLVALGGGVIGDLSGFAAAIYQRGIDFVQIPTSLLAMVDSSVGGKTGINHARGKNLIGAFHQPQAVVADTSTLSTLPPREFTAGLAEVYKYGLLGDTGFLDWLDQNIAPVQAQNPDALAEMVRHCCQMKADIVASDERESGRRALLNFGHTFAHAIEAYEQYSGYLHGEAVAVGMRMATSLSARLGWISPEDDARVQAILDRANMPSMIPAGMQPRDFLELMALDKKVRDGQLRLVLLRGIGQACVTADYQRAALEATLDNWCQAGGK